MAFTRRGSAEINVTPLIDVLLVLLVIFLIVMPSITTYQPVDTPPSEGDDVAEYAALVMRVKPDLSVVLVDEGRELDEPSERDRARVRARLAATLGVSALAAASTQTAGGAAAVLGGELARDHRRVDDEWRQSAIGAESRRGAAGLVFGRASQRPDLI